MIYQWKTQLDLSSLLLNTTDDSKMHLIKSLESYAFSVPGKALLFHIPRIIDI